MNTIEKISSTVFKTTCMCGETDHQLTIIFTNDEDQFYCLEFRLLAPVPYVFSGMNANNWFEEIWERIKAAFHVLWFGRIECMEEFMFRDKEHLEDFIKLIQPKT